MDHPSVLLQNGRPRRALGLLLEREGEWDCVDWVLWLRCLAELDLGGEAAIAFAELDRFTGRGWGEVCYWIGVCAYLGDQPRPIVERAFAAAAATSFGAAALGNAFMEYIAGRYEEADQNLRRVACRDDYVHVSQLMGAQIAMDAGNLDRAQRYLEDGERECGRLGSFLRSLWQDMCWLRWFRATENYAVAELTLSRLKLRVDARELPRLHRNLCEAEAFLAKRQTSQTIRLPLLSQLDERARASGLFRKPLLSSLYSCLVKRGISGATKEELTGELWNESYNPLIHDDRIYKSVARLRQILGDSKQAPTIIIQRGGHYCLNLSDNIG